jgi:hypothetical protein
MPINSLAIESSTTGVPMGGLAWNRAGYASVTDDHWRATTPRSAARPTAPLAFQGNPGLEAVKPLATEPNWIARLTSNAHRLASLQRGWDGPGSIAISRKLLFLATSHTRFALENLKNVSAPHLVPGGDGSIQIEWHAKHGELEFDIDARGRMSIWIRNHSNGAEFDAENEAALALFYRWAPWIASQQHDGFDAIDQGQVSIFEIAA